MSKVWLVTGSAGGLGRHIAEAVQNARNRLVATTRDPGRLDDLVQTYGTQIRAVKHDVTDGGRGPRCGTSYHLRIRPAGCRGQ